MCVRESGHRIRESGPRRDDGNTQSSREQRFRVCHVDRRRFMPDVDDVHSLTCQLVPERLHVSTDKSVHPHHTPRDQEPGDDLGYGFRLRVYAHSLSGICRVMSPGSG